MDSVIIQVQLWIKEALDVLRQTETVGEVLRETWCKCEEVWATGRRWTVRRIYDQICIRSWTSGPFSLFNYYVQPSSCLSCTLAPLLIKGSFYFYCLASLKTWKTEPGYLVWGRHTPSGVSIANIFTDVKARDRSVKNVIVFYLLFFMIIFFLERESLSRGEGQRDREHLKQAPRRVWSLMGGSIPGPWDPDLSWHQDSDTQLVEPPRCS